MLSKLVCRQFFYLVTTKYPSISSNTYRVVEYNSLGLQPIKVFISTIVDIYQCSLYSNNIKYKMSYITLYIASCSRWKSFVVFADQLVTMKLFQWNSTCNCNGPWPCKTTVQTQKSSSTLQFSSATMKLFHLEQFAIYGIIFV